MDWAGLREIDENRHTLRVAAVTTPGGRGLGEDHSAGRRECAEWTWRGCGALPG